MHKHLWIDPMPPRRIDRGEDEGNFALCLARAPMSVADSAAGQLDILGSGHRNLDFDTGNLPLQLLASAVSLYAAGGSSVSHGLILP